MSEKMSFIKVAAVCVGILASATSASALSITQTNDGTDLGIALGGGGLTIDSVDITNGNEWKQFGTYKEFSSGLVTIGNGIVLSTGKVVQTTAAFHSGIQGPDTKPSTDTGADAVDTAAFDGYGELGHITNFAESYDVAVLNVDFTLSAASHVGFDFIFGSVEYPEYTSKYADAFLAFLDGRAAGNQIVFDANGKTVQVGNSFESAVRIDDTNTAFAKPHGLLKLQTVTPVLTAGSHKISFQIGDVNDARLDSAVFISNFRGIPPSTLPEPSSLLLLGSALVALAVWRRKLTVKIRGCERLI